MADSVVQIVNLALTEIGANLIISIDDDVKSAILAKANWSMVRDAVLRAYPWNCALAWRELAQETEAPQSDQWTYSYPLPAECLRVLSADDQNIDYVISKRKIYCNETSLKIKYIERVEDPTQYDALLAQGIALRLAGVLAYPIVQSAALKDSLWGAYRAVISEARSIDAQEGSLNYVQSDDWIEARS